MLRISRELFPSFSRRFSRGQVPIREANMRLIALAAGLAISVIPALAATHTQVVECPTGGSLLFRVRGGDVHITRATDPDHIMLRYTPDPKKPDEEQKVQNSFSCLRLPASARNQGTRFAECERGDAQGVVHPKWE